MDCFKCTRLFLMASVLSMAGYCVAGADEAGGDRTIRETAPLQPGESTVLRSQVASPTALLSVVPQGRTVQEGDLLVELDDHRFKEQRRRAELRIAETEAQVEAAKSALVARQKELAMAEELAKLALSMAERAEQTFLTAEYAPLLKRAQNQVALTKQLNTLASERLVRARDRRERLARDPSQSAFQEAEMALVEAQTESLRAEMELQAAESQVQSLTEFVRERRQAELQLAVAQRRLDLERAENQHAEGVEQTEAELRIAKIRLGLEQARSAVLEAQIMACQIHAPYSGIVHYEWRPLEGDRVSDRLGPGTMIHSREPIVRIESMEHPKLILRTAADLVERVSSGQEATIRFHALSQQTFRGHVREVRVVPSPSGGSPWGQIVVQVDNPTEALKPGMTSVVEIEP
jgi:multidrug efflux pump subunit AcrA (membrane-fusion protein)